MRPPFRRLLPLTASLCALATPAAASPAFPGAIRDALDLTCRPECTICHRDVAGGYGTLDKEFGKAMLDEGGLVVKQPGTFAAALAALEASGSDVDDDGVPDVEELSFLEDPNAAGDAELECLPEPSSSSGGCRAARGGAEGQLLVSSVLGIALLLRRRNRLLR
jgi:hypothetical protein